MRDEPVIALPTPDIGGHMDNASAARPDLWICPFLRATDGAGTLGNPIHLPDPANRCVALGDTAPQSLRQQEFACLASAHVNCPRFVRGGQAMVESSSAVGGQGTKLTPAIIGALLVLAASFALSVGFVVANGGMDLPAVAIGSQGAGQASVAPGPSGSPASSAGAGSEAPASIAPSPEPSVEATVEPATATPEIEPTPTPPDAPSPTDAPTPNPTSDRYALLDPCPDAPDCWIYTIRAGDNLVSIARYFGVPLEVVHERNPWTETTPLVAGQELRLPPPTR